jgi:hypothetical protein
VPALNELATELYDDTNTYADLVHFVTLYVIEPHPTSPDISPYKGTVWEDTYSTKGQAFTYEERVAYAQETLGLLEGNQRILVDDLTPGDLNNPVWCTYGTCPNCAFLIGQDGLIDVVQTWVDVEYMKEAIDRLFAGS